MAMHQQAATSDPALHALALRLAHECRRIVQACLMESEWADCDREFHAVIFDGLEKAYGQNSEPSPTQITR